MAKFAGAGDVDPGDAVAMGEIEPADHPTGSSFLQPRRTGGFLQGRAARPADDSGYGRARRRPRGPDDLSPGRDFIQRKPTRERTDGSCCWAVCCSGGPWSNLSGASLSLTDEGWRKLTLRWGLFFYVVAAANEVALRNLSMDAWLNFKVFGILGMTFLFLLLKLLLQRYARAARRHRAERRRRPMTNLTPK